MGGDSDPSPIDLDGFNLLPRPTGADYRSQRRLLACFRLVPLWLPKVELLPTLVGRLEPAELGLDGLQAKKLALAGQVIQGNVLDPDHDPLPAGNERVSYPEFEEKLLNLPEDGLLAAPLTPSGMKCDRDAWSRGK